MYTRENQNPEWSSLRPTMPDPSYTQPDSLLYRPSSDFLPDRPRFALLPDRPSSALLPDRPRSALLPDRPRSALLPDRPISALLPDHPSSALLPDRPTSAFPFPPDRSAGTYLADGTITAVPHPGSVASTNMVTARNHYQNSDRDPSSAYSMSDSSSVVNKRCNSDSSFKPASVATAIDPDDIQARLLKLQNETGYDIIQRHGQRIYGGPPPGWQGEFPGKGTEVYCYRLPRDCFEDELVPIFSQVGQIFELRLMIEFSGTNRTYCYVRYTKMDHAMEAIRSLDGYEIRTGQHLAVTKSVDNRRLWINGIPKNRTSEEFMEELGAITDGISNVILYPSQTEANKTRSYMFVEYESHRAAALARRKLVPGKVFLFGVEVGQVDWAEPEPEVDEQQMKHIKVLYVRQLNIATSEQTIGNCFSQLCNGQVERVRKPKDFAFVHFNTRESAELAMSRSSQLHIDGQKVEVLWAKPQEKSKKLDIQANSFQPLGAFQNWSPCQVLEAVCKSNNWGSPDYKLACARDPMNGLPLYNYTATIPRYPVPYPGNVFQVPKWMMSEVGAKTVTAQHVLAQINLRRSHPSPLAASNYPPPDHSRVASGQNWASVFPRIGAASNQFPQAGTYGSFNSSI